MNPDPAHFDLTDIEHEPTDEQLAALIECVAVEARRRGEQARREILGRVKAGIAAAMSDQRFINESDQTYPLPEVPMSAKVQFTGSVDRDLLERAEILAARADTSVNALFNAELRYLVETFEAADAAGNGNFKVLLDFSLGRIDDLAAMDVLGIASEEDLFLLMAQAHLPMPRLDPDITESMVAELHSLST